MCGLLTTLKTSSSKILLQTPRGYFWWVIVIFFFIIWSSLTNTFLGWFILFYKVSKNCYYNIMISQISVVKGKKRFKKIARSHIIKFFDSRFLYNIVLFDIFSLLRVNSFFVLSITLIRKEMRFVKYMLCQGHKNLSLNI